MNYTFSLYNIFGCVIVFLGCWSLASWLYRALTWCIRLTRREYSRDVGPEEIERLFIEMYKRKDKL